MRKLLINAIELVVGVAGGLLFGMAIAYAADPSDAGVVSGLLGVLTRGFEPIVNSLVELVVTAAVGWIAYRLNTWFGVQIDAKHRETLHSALRTGAQIILAGAGSTSAEAIAIGVEHVRKGAGDAIRRFKLDPDRLEAMLRAKIEEAGAPMALDPPAVPVRAD